MDIFILSAVRTPIGKFLGELSEVPAPKLGAAVAAEALKRAGVSADQIDEAIFGNVVQAGVGQNPRATGGFVCGASRFHRGLHGQQSLRLGLKGRHASGPGDQGGRLPSRVGRWHGKHEPGAAPTYE